MIWIMLDGVFCFMLGYALAEWATRRGQNWPQVCIMSAIITILVHVLAIALTALIFAWGLV